MWYLFEAARGARMSGSRRACSGCSEAGERDDERVAAVLALAMAGTKSESGMMDYKPGLERHMGRCSVLTSGSQRNWR